MANIETWQLSVQPWTDNLVSVRLVKLTWNRHATQRPELLSQLYVSPDNLRLQLYGRLGELLGAVDDFYRRREEETLL